MSSFAEASEDARRTRPVVAFPRRLRRQRYFTLGGGSAGGVRHSPDENAEPGALLFRRLRRAVEPRLTLDHITRISKVRCTSKSSHAVTRGSLHDAQVGRIDRRRDVEFARRKARRVWDRGVLYPRFRADFDVCFWPEADESCVRAKRPLLANIKHQTSALGRSIANVCRWDSAALECIRIGPGSGQRRTVAFYD